MRFTLFSFARCLRLRIHHLIVVKCMSVCVCMELSVALFLLFRVYFLFVPIQVRSFLLLGAEFTTYLRYFIKPTEAKSVKASDISLVHALESVLVLSSRYCRDMIHERAYDNELGTFHIDLYREFQNPRSPKTLDSRKRIRQSPGSTRTLVSR